MDVREGVYVLPGVRRALYIDAPNTTVANCTFLGFGTPLSKGAPRVTMIDLIRAEGREPGGGLPGRR